MVWLLWVYTTRVTNWLDPERIAVRLMLLGLAGASLVMSAALLRPTPAPAPAPEDASSSAPGTPPPRSDLRA